MGGDFLPLVTSLKRFQTQHKKGEKMIDIKRFNHCYGLNYKKLKGSMNGYKYAILKVDNSIIYFNKETYKIRICNL